MRSTRSTLVICTMMITLSAVFCARAESAYSLAGAGSDERMPAGAAAGMEESTSAGTTAGSQSGSSDSTSTQEHVDRSGGRVFTTDASDRPAPGTFPASGSEILPDDEMLTVMGASSTLTNETVAGESEWVKTEMAGRFMPTI